MSDQRIVEQFKLLKTAKKLEQMGNAQRALELYLELHEKYEPNTSDAYERPALLLERFKRYDEALAICQEAIEEIQNDRMSGTIDKFEKRIASIQEKMKDSPVKKEKEDKYVFGIIGFRSKKPFKMVVATVAYALFLSGMLISPHLTLALIFVTYAFTYFIDLMQTKGKHRIILMVLSIVLTLATVFSISQLPSAFNEFLAIDDKDQALEGGDGIFQDPDELPIISDQHIEDATTVIMNEVEVSEAGIEVYDNQVVFVIELKPQTNKERAIVIAETYVEALAHMVSNDTDLKAPTSRSLGELYDYYHITVVGGSDANDLVLKGSKGTSQKYIYWRD